MAYQPYHHQELTEGRFTAQYIAMGLDQRHTCFKCNIGNAVVPHQILPEAQCIWCLLDTCKSAITLHQENEDLLHQRDGFINWINQNNPRLVSKFKTQRCRFDPNCDDGLLCIYHHEGEDWFDYQAILQPSSIVGCTATQEAPQLTCIFSWQYQSFAQLQYQDCLKCNYVDMGLSGRVIPNIVFV
ncbi:hypothetical protein TSUD_381410 [Trifolium subterraneum]|uniref:Uncharacterized protein n=1 Tax=Trifolium subterraneum TaxID=3900 RepID=A0A2Z6LP27_TRISU|nr:hypothetical protein TSUD_381410 [Trifolium subterraneum]